MRAMWTPPKSGTTPDGISSVSFASGFASPYAANVSGATSTRTGMTSSNASLSPFIETEI